MKLKLSQLIEARAPLQRLAAEKYPAHIAYRIQRNLRAVEPESRAYEKAREDLIKTKYGVPIENAGVPTGGYRVPPERINEYMTELGLLLEEQVDVNITLLELESIHEITPLDLMALEWMFEVSGLSQMEAAKPTAPKTRRRNGTHKEEPMSA